jgi:hypothetical protein
MLRAPIEHQFSIDGESYILRESGRGGQERYRREFALALAAAPDILDRIDGVNLYAQAVARQCLRQAPACFWRMDVTSAVRAAAAPDRLWELVSFEQVGLEVWEHFRKEVDAFVAQLPQPLPDESQPAPPGLPTHEDAVAVAEAVPPAFRGHAQ